MGEIGRTGRSLPLLSLLFVPLLIIALYAVPSSRSAIQRLDANGAVEPHITIAQRAIRQEGSDRPVLPLLAFGAVCDGSHDDRLALVRALAYLEELGGGILETPNSDCRVLQTAESVFIGIGANISIRGSGPLSRVLLACQSPDAYNELFRIQGDSVSLESVTLIRTTACQGTMLQLQPSRGFSLLGVVIDGQGQSLPGSVHGVALANKEGVFSDLTIDHSTFRNLDFGFFQADSARTRTMRVSVTNSNFTGNSADDLEFNAPSGSMTDVTVADSDFADSRSDSVGSGFAIGVAHVAVATIQDNTFSGYRTEAIHIENRSTNVLVQRNTFRRSGTRAVPWASHVFVVSGSAHVNIVQNIFDAGDNDNVMQAIYGGPGGVDSPRPHDIAVFRNTFFLSRSAEAMELDAVDRVSASGNVNIDR